MPESHIAQKSSGLLYALDGVAPTIDPTAWVAPTAVLIGDVRLGPGANIWFNCVLRADTNPIIVGARSNIQDGTIIHVDHGENFTEIGEGRDGRATRRSSMPASCATGRLSGWGRRCWTAR